MSNLSRRRLLQAVAVTTASTLLPNVGRSETRIVLNDASRLNPIPVFRHWRADGGDEQALIARLRSELKDAAALRRPFIVGGARHSMGGQSIPRDGHALTNALNVFEPDRAANVYRTHSGTRWIQLIAALDRIGFSPAVMQSNADFSAGGTLSVNAHGWPVPFGPFGTTVQAFRLMLADGTVVRCSATENSELFGLVTGGYGLFGVVLDMELTMVKNAMLQPTIERMPAELFGPRFARTIESDPNVQMAYGRLQIARRGFLEEALMVMYRPIATEKPLPPAGVGGLFASVSREVFRAQIGSQAAKRARWVAETALRPSRATRNTLMNEPVANLAGRNPARTDILHEYFVAPARFPDFLAASRDVILKSKQDLLNVTLRYVRTDPSSVLPYATEPRIAAVMLFSQAISPEAEADMLRMTEALIEQVIAIGGSFYLPYRLHARRDQVERAYPRLAWFVERKRHYDSGPLFRNELWHSYMAS